MCERYVLPDQTAAEREFVPQLAWWRFTEKFNVAPPQFVPALRIHDGQTEGMMMRWGLIPSWSEGKSTGRPAVGAELGRIERSKLFRMPWLSGQRCILPAAGFYVWQLTSENYRQPYFVRLTNRAVFGIAAVWDRSEDEEGDVIESCTVVRVAANALVTELGNAPALMPAILKRRHYQTWLQGTPGAAKEVVYSYNAAWMQGYAVSPRINSTGADDAGLIAPVH